MKTKQTKKRVSYRLSNDVVEMIKFLKEKTGKTATEIIQEAVKHEHEQYNFYQSI